MVLCEILRECYCREISKNAIVRNSWRLNLPELITTRWRYHKFHWMMCIHRMHYHHVETLLIWWWHVSGTETPLILTLLMKSGLYRVHDNTLRPRQNGGYFADNIFKCIFLNEIVWISIIIWRQFVANSPINNIWTLVQIMAWHWPGDRPLSEPLMVRLLMHICIPRPQWDYIRTL